MVSLGTCFSQYIHFIQLWPATVDWSCHCILSYIRPLHIDSLWKVALTSNSSDQIWKLIWKRIHQAIHFDFILRTYFSPCTLHKIKAPPSPNLCNQNASGNFFIWHVSVEWLQSFGRGFQRCYQAYCPKLLLIIPEIMLLNDTSSLKLC